MNITAYCVTHGKPWKWFLLDANSKTLGRISTEISNILLGKQDSSYTLGQQPINGVIVINASKVIITGKKQEDKLYITHSGRPGGLTIETFKALQVRMPNRIIESSVKGMLPKNSLGRKLFTKLKVYSGNEHPHTAQHPVPVYIQ
uniref:Ribosomal protein L13 n=1 Tax=Cryptomonas sp. CCAC 1634B TaxID=2051848 RepID=A0A679C9U2_9CRYP|nr:ribosomal protein L13 [Cryptomonas sp. CCAC 1634B]